MLVVPPGGGWGRARAKEWEGSAHGGDWGDMSPVPWRACPPPTAMCSLEFSAEVAEGSGRDALLEVLQSSAHPSLWSLSLLWLNFLPRHSCRLPALTTNLKALRILGPYNV